MTPMMGFAEAVETLRRGPQSGLDGYVRHAVASVVYHAHTIRRPTRDRRLTYDLAPGRIGDQRAEGGPPNIRGIEPTPFSEQLTEGGLRPGAKVGGKLVAQFAGDNASAFIIVAHGDGTCGVYQVGKADGVMDPGSTTVRDYATRDVAAEVEANAAAIMRMLDRLPDHPSYMAKQDANWSRNTLAEINRRNREFYKGGSNGNAA
jgi:hypothetical protein